MAYNVFAKTPNHPKIRRIVIVEPELLLIIHECVFRVSFIFLIAEVVDSMTVLVLGLQEGLDLLERVSVVGIERGCRETHRDDFWGDVG